MFYILKVVFVSSGTQGGQTDRQALEVRQEAAWVFRVGPPHAKVVQHEFIAYRPIKEITCLSRKETLIHI